MMKKKRMHRILGIILAISLPLSIISGITIGVMATNEVRDIIWNRSKDVLSSNYITATAEAKEITKLNITNSIGKVIILPTTDDVASINYNDEYVNANFTNDTLIVKEINKKFWRIDWFAHNPFDDIIITIKLPLKLTDVIIEGGAGEISLSGFSIDNLYLGGGIGAIDVNNCTINKTANIDSGVGSVKLFNNTGTPNYKIEQGVGEINLENVTANNIDINGGVGATKLDTITANDVSIEGGVGSIKINNSTIKRLSGSQGLGEIKVDKNTTVGENRLGFGD